MNLFVISERECQECNMSDCSDDEAATDKQLKVVIVGDGASGKASLI